MGIETFNCFKRVCVIERNTSEGSRSDPAPKEVQSVGIKKIIKSTHKAVLQEDESSGSDNEATIHAMTGPAPKPWNPPPVLKLSCPLNNHKHEVSTCADFFSFSSLDRWEKIEKGRMCYSYLNREACVKEGNIIMLLMFLKF